MTTKENEANRFNKGKVKYSYIDFNLFKDMYQYFDRISHLKTKEACIEDIFSVLSNITFTYDIIAHRIYVPLLQALVYKLTILKLNLSFHNSPVYDLRAFTDMAKVLDYGAKKYERNNWLKGYVDRFSTVDSLYRHLKEIIIGNETDEESGLSHMGHIMCNVMFLTNDLLVIEREKKEEN